MKVPSVRRLLFDRLVVNLALLLGLSQFFVWHWFRLVVQDAPGPGFARGLALVLTLVIANGLVVSPLRRARRRTDWRGRVAAAYMDLGVATLLLGLAVALSWLVLLLLAGTLGALGASQEKGFAAFRIASMGLVGGVALLVGWGFAGGQARVERTRVRVGIPGLHPDLAGLRIVQISDLHIGSRMQGAGLDRMVARTNALEPDVLVLTGDIFDFDPSYIDDGARRLGALRARYGVYAILGNHDAYTGAERVASGLARRAPNLRLLRDEVVKLPVPAPLYLAGVEDRGRDWSARGLQLEGLSAVAAARPDDAPTLLLVHRPEAFQQAAELGFPLVLSGHTHGGQLALPTPGGRYNLARLVTPFTRGLYRIGGSVLYVNRGLGVAGPKLRINCPREIATVELQPLLEHVH